MYLFFIIYNYKYIFDAFPKEYAGIFFKAIMIAVIFCLQFLGASLTLSWD
tara:strand:- start:172 stop:321 length:150 start_codon:yes stop_codon:yes gene_type:complete